MQCKDLVKLLAQNGWFAVRQKGSHMQFNNAARPGFVTVPAHGLNSEIAPGTLKSIEEQSGLRFEADRRGKYKIVLTQ